MQDVASMQKQAVVVIERALALGFRPIVVVVGDPDLWRGSVREGASGLEWPAAKNRIETVYASLKEALVGAGSYVIDGTAQLRGMPLADDACHIAPLEFLPQGVRAVEYLKGLLHAWALEGLVAWGLLPGVDTSALQRSSGVMTLDDFGGLCDVLWDARDIWWQLGDVFLVQHAGQDIQRILSDDHLGCLISSYLTWP